MCYGGKWSSHLPGLFDVDESLDQLIAAPHHHGKQHRQPALPTRGAHIHACEQRKPQKTNRMKLEALDSAASELEEKSTIEETTNRTEATSVSIATAGISTRQEQNAILRLRA